MLLAGLGAGAVGAAAAAAPILGLRLADTAIARPSSWWDRTFVSLQSAGLAEWTGIVGETFTLQGLNGSNLLRIAAVTAFPRSGTRPTSLARSQAFSVTFESLSGPPLPATDRLYQLTHASYPTLPIYMGAPIAGAGRPKLIAVFN